MIVEKDKFKTHCKIYEEHDEDVCSAMKKILVFFKQIMCSFNHKIWVSVSTNEIHSPT